MDFLKRIFELFSTPKYMEMIFKGLGTTLSITVVATIIGLVLGIIVAFVSIAPKSKVMSVFKAICKGEIDGFSLKGRYPDGGTIDEN